MTNSRFKSSALNINCYLAYLIMGGGNKFTVPGNHEYKETDRIDAVQSHP